MKKIRGANDGARKLCGIQKEKDGVVYRLTKHCLQISLENGKLMYHTLTGEMILLEREEKPEDFRPELIQSWFLVPSEFDENKFSDDIHRLASILQPVSNGKDSFTIFSTTDCNARCFYCYEMGRSRISMTEQTASDVAQYIARASKGKKVHLRWFGGEPLFNIPAIDVITSTLKDLCVPFKSSMTSNGFYLSRSVADQAVSNWNLEMVQITIDGTETVYNRTKSYIDDDINPFQRVLNNIEAALDAGISVYIRLNVDSANANDILDAVDILGSRFRGRKNCRIIVALLRSFAGKVHEFKTDEDAAACYYRLMDKIHGNGLSDEAPVSRQLSANRCMADSDSSEVILPDGRLGKCEHFSETELIGSIYSTERNEEVIREWKKRRTIIDMPECADCPLYPRCINLEKCDWTKNGCPLSVRMIRTKKLKQQLLREYKTGR